jgi:hypothetical protein
MKKTLLYLLLSLGYAGFVAAQSGPQIPLSGSIGVPGSAPTLCSASVVIPSDANYTLTANQAACNSLYVTSSVSLTALRNVVAPLNYGQQFTITNATTGGQSIQVIGTSGTGATIPSGQTLVVNSPNGTAYVVGGAAATSGSSSGTTVAALWGFGTSIIAGLGAKTQSGFSLLAGTTTAPAFNNGLGGSRAANDIGLLFQLYAPDPVSPSAVLFETGENDTNACGTVPSGCTVDMFNMYMAADAWVAIPPQFRILASTATTTGTWSNDTTFATYQPSTTISFGTPLSSSSSGSTLTFSIPSSNSPVVGVTYGIGNSFTGTFTVKVDGTLVVDNCSSTTTFGSGPCGGHNYTPSTYSFYRQEFTVTSGTTHTVVVTKTNSAESNIVGADWIPPSTNPNNGIVFHDAVLGNFAGATTWNPLAISATSKLLADGLNVFYVDLINGTPGVNQTTDISVTATSNCPASTASGHPNDCGYLHMFQTIVNKEIAAGVNIGVTNQIGLSFANTGIFLNNPLLRGGTPTGSSNYSSLTSGTVGAGIVWYQNGVAINDFGAGNGVDAGTGTPYSGAFVNRIFAPFLPVWNCDATYNNGGLDNQSSFFDARCTNVGTGDTYQFGSATASNFLVGTTPLCRQDGTNCPSLGGTAGGDLSGTYPNPTVAKIHGSQSLTGVQGTTGTVLLACAGAVGSAGVFIEYDANGNCTSSGVSQASFALLTANNSWTGNNGFVGNTQFETVTSATSGANHNSPNTSWNASYWTGSATANDVWSCLNTMGTGTNPTSTFTCTQSGTPGGASFSIPAVKARVYTVSTLPTASSLPAGTMVEVSDGTVAVTNPCTGSGTDYQIAITNGTTWSCH